VRGLGAVPVAIAGRHVDGVANVFSVACELPHDLPLFPGLDAPLAYWTRKRGAHLIPGRQDIDPAEMREFLPRIMLADVEGSPHRFRYRVAGTGICHVHADEATGMLAHQLAPSHYGDLVHRQYAGVVQARNPALHLNVLEDRDTYHAYAHLVLPLARDHETVDMILTIDGRCQDKARMMNLLVALQARDGIEVDPVYRKLPNLTT
jgi:hypothetical protein